MCNNSVVLSTDNAGSTWPGNGSTLTFAKTNGSVWTTVRFGTPMLWGIYINVTDGMFTYIAADTQKGSIGPLNFMIPEFAAILIPIVGMMAIFFIFRSRKKKHGE